MNSFLATKIDKAREAFRQADNDEKSRINSYTSEIYETGDKVYFKENDKIEWSGPAVVIGHERKVVFLKYGNKLRSYQNWRRIQK